jgi:hypothetical protein
MPDIVLKLALTVLFELKWSLKWNYSQKRMYAHDIFGFSDFYKHPVNYSKKGRGKFC